MQKPHPIAFTLRHWKGLVAAGVILGAAAGAGYKAISDARAERMISVPAADVVGLRQDIGDLRSDIRDERKAREDLGSKLVDLNGRLGRLEGAEAAKGRK
jgi:hypothetical protein